MKLSKEWLAVINSLTDSLKVPPYNFRWNTYDSSDKPTFPERYENRSSSIDGDTNIEFAVFIEEFELE